MAVGLATTTIINYSGQLFDRSNNDTPLVSNLSRRKTKDMEFVINSTYATPEGEIPNISEQDSLTAPEPSYITRAQSTNVVQIFQETTGVSYVKQANTAALGGINTAGQINNVPNEFDFQMAATTRKVRKSLEKTLIQGTYQKSTRPDQASKTRGLIQAITTNVEDAAGAELNYDLLNKLLRKMFKNGADMSGLIIMCDAVTKAQITNNWAKLPGYLLPNSRTVGGLAIDQIVTDLGTLGIMPHQGLPAGTVLLVNMSVLQIVEMDTPGKGNFFWEPLAKTGAAEKGMLFGMAGLDYGPEWWHGKITGLATSVKDLMPADAAAAATLNIKP